MTAEPLLEAEGLAKTYHVSRGPFRRVRIDAVADVDISLPAGGALGLVGESGCGKSTIARLVLRLTAPTGGRVRFEGRDITGLDEVALRPLRRRMQLIHQNPSAALDPRMDIAATVAEPLEVQQVARGAEARGRAAALLAEVGLPSAFLHRHPHELSGGQKQRVCIARALALEPRLVVLDEPTSALDVSVQAQILGFLHSLRERRGLAYLFISHNLAVVRQVCERVAVMYLGRIIEEGPTSEVLVRPRHPYTRALLASVPRLRASGGTVPAAAGDPPDPANPPPGCAFHPRCAHAEPRCRAERPSQTLLAPGHVVACHPAAEGRL